MVVRKRIYIFDEYAQIEVTQIDQLFLLCRVIALILQYLCIIVVEALYTNRA